MKKESLKKENEVRKWLRRMYNCRWIFTDNLITIICDGEEFNLDPAMLDEEETEMLIKIIQDASRKVDESVWEFGPNS